MMQLQGFVEKSQEQKVWLLQRSIYKLKQVSNLWNIRFYQTIKSYGYDKVLDENFVYLKIKEGK